MNNNIKETTSLVFVKGKNLYNKNSNFGNVLIDGNGVATANNVWTCSNNIKVKGNTEYTLSWTNINGQPQIEICEYKEDGTFIGNNFQTLNTGVTFYMKTLNSNTDFVKVAYRNDRQDNIQFEQGPATPYKLYVEKQIHIKNKNGVFEEFYGESELNQENYSLGEQKIGSWINGKPLYRKVLDFGALPNNGSKDMSYDDTYNIVYINGYAWQNSYGTPIPNSHQNDNNAINLFVQNLQHKVTIETYMDRSSYTNCFIWIYYTKTTD